MVYNSCLTCVGNQLGFKGLCIDSCPQGYANQSGTCLPCGSYCMVCDSSRCLICQSYAYTYKESCVLDCAVTDLPKTVDTYCTLCAEVPYCATCQS